MPKENEPLTVTGLNKRIKSLLEGEPSLRDVLLRGEISNFKAYPSGHAYFSLKDDSSVVGACMWQSNVRKLRFKPKDGDKVIVRGSLNVYPPRGTYSFVCETIAYDGEGDELAKLRALAEKLRSEGLFDESRKKKIPAFPKRIGIIAGKGSAGMKDITHNASLRWPLVTLVMIPSLVQGPDAPEDLLRALRLAESSHIDTLIIGRGGGSSEDLGAFNDETLVRAVAASKIPVISAVGHEIDTTLIDLVADLRVSTPTGAAVAATPNKDDILMALADAQDTLRNAIEALLRRKKEKVELLTNRSFFTNPKAIYESKAQEVAKMEAYMKAKVQSLLLAKKAGLDAVSGKLAGLNPENVLKRGYAISQTRSGKVLSSIKEAKQGDEIITHLKDGIITSSVTEVTPSERR